MAADAMRVERAQAAPRQMAARRAKAAHGPQLQAVAAGDIEVASEAVSLADSPGPAAVPAPAVQVMAVGPSGRADLRGKDRDDRLSFTLTGIGEKRALALLATGPGPGEKKRDRSAAVMSAARVRSMDSDAVPSKPVVTHLANGASP